MPMIATAAMKYWRSPLFAFSLTNSTSMGISTSAAVLLIITASITDETASTALPFLYIRNPSSMKKIMIASL